MATSTKVRQNIGDGLWVPYGAPADQYVAAVGETFDDETGESFYHISFYQGQMGAFSSKNFDNLEDLVAAMREVEPDLRRWHTRTEE